MGMEIYAILLNFPESCQGKHLKSAGICQNRTIPDHKLMQSAHFFDQLVSWTHMQMIGIGQFHLTFDLFEIHC